MTVLENLLSIIVVLFIGYWVSKTGWKLRYLAPWSFLTVFVSVSLFVLRDYSNRGTVIIFFVDGDFSPNLHAVDLLFVSIALACVSTFLLVLSVWAIRKNVFF